MNTVRGLDDRIFRKLFEECPGLFLVLTPTLQIVGVTEAYLAATMTVREEIIGRGLFEVFPDNPEDPFATGVSNLRNSLQTVLRLREPHTMAIQRYDVRKQDGEFEVRYWSPINTPILDEGGEVDLIIHRVEDVTELMLLKSARSVDDGVRRRLQAIIEAMPDGVIVTNLAGEIVLVNGRAEAMFGYRPGEMQGRAVENLMPLRRELDTASTPELKAIIHQIRSQDSWSTIRSKDGYEFPVHFAASHMASEDGEYSIYAIRDMTDVQNAKRQVHETTERYQDLLDHMFEAVQILGYDWRYLYLNDAAVRNGGQRKEEMLGKTVMERYPGFENTEMYRVLDECMQLRLSKVQEFEFEYPDGRTAWFELSIHPVPEGLFILAIEISARKTIEENTRRTNELLDQKVRERTQQLEEAIGDLESFSYSVSHDLRAPLRHILGYIGMLKKASSGHLPDECGRYMRVIESASREMGQLIDDLLTFSRMGRAELQFADVSLDRIMLETLKALESEVQDREIVWKISSLPVVRGDASMLRVAMVNLVGNAVKYSRGRAPAVIEVSAEDRDEGEVTICVRDNGAGFDMRYMDKLFGVFQRLHRADEFEGTGIGLAIVRRLLSRMDGQIWAEAELDKGAAFFFTLKKASSEGL